MKFSLMVLSLLSLNAFATTIVDVEGLNTSGLLSKGTGVGACKVIKSDLVRAYGNGAITGMQLTVSKDGKEYSALLNEKLSFTESREGNVLESFSESTTGGTGILIKEKKTEQKVTIVYKGISPGEEAVVKLSIEKRVEGFFGMKKDKTQSVVCE